jgi:hypothetical protein
MLETTSFAGFLLFLKWSRFLGLAAKKSEDAEDSGAGCKPVNSETSILLTLFFV